MNNEISNQVQENGDLQFQLRDVFFKYLTKWYLFLVFTTLFLALSYAYIYFSVPQYNIESYVVAQDDKKTASSRSQDLLKELNLFSGAQLVDNEVEILKSRFLIGKTVEQLKLNVRYYKNLGLKSKELYKNNPIFIQFDTIIPEKTKVVYSITILNKEEILFSYSGEEQEFNQKGTKYKFGDTIVTPIGKFSVWRNPNFLTFFDGETVQAEYKAITAQISEVAKSVSSYRSKLKIELTTKTSTVLKLSIEDNIPGRGKDFLNTLMNVYIKNDVDLKNETGGISLKFISERLKILSSDVNEIETTYEQFRTVNKITDIGNDASLVLNNLLSLDKEIGLLDNQLAVIDGVEKYINSNTSPDAIAPAMAGINDPMTNEMLRQILALEGQKLAIKKSTKDDNPLLVSLNNQIGGLKKTLAQNITNIKSGLIISKVSLQKKVNSYDAEIRRLPKKEHELFDIKRQMEIKQNLYIYLLQKQEEAAISLASTVSDNHILDAAVSSENPVKPVKQIIYGLAILLGLLVPVLIVELNSTLSFKIKSKSEIESKVSFPVVGVVPLAEGTSAVVVTKNAKSGVSEAFRTIRTNLQYLSKGNEKVVMCVTSNISGEGKTFFSLNLASSIAITNKKVVMLELDLRKPKLSKSLNIHSSIGISNYLIGQVKLSDIILNSGIDDNLDILPSGPIPPNPAELLVTDQMRDMLRQLSEKYDYVIIDTPPIGLVSDAFTIADYCHHVFYILRYDYTDKNYLAYIQELYTSKKLKNAAMVLNGVKAGMGHGYNYGYGYGYGYGYYSDDKQKLPFWKRIFNSKG